MPVPPVTIRSPGSNAIRPRAASSHAILLAAPAKPVTMEPAFHCTVLRLCRVATVHAISPAPLAKIVIPRRARVSTAMAMAMVVIVRSVNPELRETAYRIAARMAPTVMSVARARMASVSRLRAEHARPASNVARVVSVTTRRTTPRAAATKSAVVARVRQVRPVAHARMPRTAINARRISMPSKSVATAPTTRAVLIMKATRRAARPMACAVRSAHKSSVTKPAVMPRPSTAATTAIRQPVSVAPLARLR
jgi:hypothetical protein